jgi:hypothetical protein
MTRTKWSVAAAGLAMASMTISAPAMAQESSYKPGTVWETSRIKVLPGQFENYMDYLATSWKKIQEYAKAQGIVASYHVLSTNSARTGEPDLILVIEYKDYLTTAQRDAFSKEANTLLSQDDRKADTAAGKREVMRELIGAVEYQELNLK